MYNKFFKKIKKLQTKIILSMIAMAIGMGAIVGVFGTSVTRFSTTDALEKTLTEGMLPSASALRASLATEGIVSWKPYLSDVSLQLMGEELDRGMAPAEQCERGFVERLDAHRDAVDAAVFQRLHFVGTDA